MARAPGGYPAFADRFGGRSGRVFRDLTADQQRVVLQQVALHLVPKSRYRLHRDALVVLLAEQLAKRVLADRTRTEPNRVAERWVRFLTQSTGLIVEVNLGDFEFLHHALVEYLAGQALLDRSDDEVVGFVLSNLWRWRWRSVFPLMLSTSPERIVHAVTRKIREKAQKAQKALLAPYLWRRWSDFGAAIGDDGFLLYVAKNCIQSGDLHVHDLMQGAVDVAMVSDDWFRVAMVSDDWPRVQGLAGRHDRPHDEPIERWLTRQLARSTGKALQGVIALLPGTPEWAPPRGVAKRDDVDHVVLSCLDFGAEHPWGEWARSQASGTLTRQWVQQVPTASAVVYWMQRAQQALKAATDTELADQLRAHPVRPTPPDWCRALAVGTLVTVR